ncbi:MAG TPA: RIP metalloprotease RseP [Candidatus Dojkabacteria bacterium]|jgi:regulator of sigma E protease
MELLLSIIIITLIFGFLVFVHEAGHFIAAKLNKVMVEEFAFGFGPKILSKKVGGTEYKINVIPLGGYVKMFGDEDAASSKQNPEVADDPRSYQSKKIWQKMTIVAAGVIVNFVVAFLIFYIYLFISDFKPDPILKITNFNFIGTNQEELMVFSSIDERSAADEADLPELGFLYSIDGNKVSTRSEFNEVLSQVKGGDVELEVMIPESLEIESYTLELDDNTKALDNSVNLGIYPISSFRVPAFIEEDPESLYYYTLDLETSAANSSDFFEEGYLLSINNTEISNIDDLREILNNNENGTINVQIQNLDGEIKEVNVELGEKQDDGNVKLGIGVPNADSSAEATQVFFLDYNANKAFSGIAHTINTTVYQAIGLGNVIGRAFQGQPELLAESVASPIKIGEVVYELVSTDNFSNIVNLTALISATLAFMNLLPIPLIDGGQLVLLALEKLRGKPLSEKVQDIISKVGFGFIVGLGVIVLLKDFWQVILSRIF